MRKKLFVDIFKTADQNLEILLSKVIVPCVNKADLIKLKRRYKLAVFLFQEIVFDLRDFEVKDPKSRQPKINLDSVINHISAIVLIKIKDVQQEVMSSLNVAMQECIIEEDAMSDRTITENSFSSDSEIEDATRSTGVINSEECEPPVSKHRMRAKGARRKKTDQPSVTLDHLP